MNTLSGTVADLEKRLRLKGEELALAQNADAMLREQLKARAVVHLKLGGCCVAL